MHINQLFSNMGIYETPYMAKRTGVGSRLGIVEFKKVMHEPNSILSVFEEIPTFHATIENVVQLHSYSIPILRMGIYEVPIFQ